MEHSYWIQRRQEVDRLVSQVTPKLLEVSMNERMNKYAAADVHGALGCYLKNLCGGDASSCPGSYPTAAFPEFYVGCRKAENV